MTMSAPMSKIPTVRSEIETVIAVRVARARLMRAVRKPFAAANSSLREMKKNSLNQYASAASTPAPAMPMSHRSCVVIVVMLPNKKLTISTEIPPPR